MKKLLTAIALFYSTLAWAQNPPQHINANYQYQGVGGDSATRMAKGRAANANFIDTGMFYFNRTDLKLHWLYDKIHDTTFQPGPGNVFHYNILNFGAIRDSTVDNTANIQRALDSAHVTGGTCYWPSFVWKAGKLHSYSNVYIYGEDQGTILKTTATDTAIVVGSNSFASFNIIQGYAPISNIAINGQGTCAVGIYTELVYWFKWMDINIYGMTFASLYNKGTLTGEFDNCWFWSGSYGVISDSVIGVPGQVSPNLLKFNNCRFYHHPIWGAKTNLTQGDVQYVNCDFEDNGTIHTYNTGAIYDSHPSAQGPALLLQNTWFEANLGAIMRIDSGTARAQVTLINVNSFQNTGASVGLYATSPSAANLLINVIGSTIVGDSVDVLMDGNGIMTQVGSDVGTNNLGLLSNYLIKKFPVEQQLVSFTTTSGAGVVTPGAGAGTGATGTLSSISSSGGGTITITTGTTPSASATVATIALEAAAAFATGNTIIIGPGNANAAQAISLGLFGTGGTTFPFQLTIANGTTALLPGTVYIINYVIIGK